MIVDKNLELASSWVPTPAVSAGETLSTTWDCAGVAFSRMTDPTDGDSTIAAGTALDREPGAGEPVYMVFTVKAVGTSGGSSNCALRILTADNDTGTSGAVILAQTTSFNPRPGNDLVVGQRIAVRLENPLQRTMKRFIGVSIYNNSGGTMAGLNLSVHVVHGDQSGPQMTYPTAFIAPSA